MNIDIDSFIIIPGVTIYNSIYQRGNKLIFEEQTGAQLIVDFLTEGDVDRFFIQISRDQKIDQIVN